MTKRLIFLFLLLPMLSLWGRAQGVDAILKIVEQNNKDLQALRKDTEASSLEIRSRNLPLSDGPSVEYSPFFRKGAGRMASSELVVSQGFDFPALQTARAKQGRLERQELTRQYAIQRRDILLQAKMCCLDLVYQNQQYKLLTRRKNVAKHLQELCFYHFVKRQSKKKRTDYYLMSKFRMRNKANAYIPVLHRMFYVPAPLNDTLWLALCLYSPLLFDIPSKCLIVNSANGQITELDKHNNTRILSVREKQVLNLIDKGMTSKEIAGLLSISINTVSRHRQEILSKLQVKNSIEACRVAKNLNLI